MVPYSVSSSPKQDATALVSLRTGNTIPPTNGPSLSSFQAPNEPAPVPLGPRACIFEGYVGMTY